MALHNKKGNIMPKSVIYKGHRYVRIDNIEQRIKGIDATIKSCENTIKRKLIASDRACNIYKVPSQHLGGIVKTRVTKDLQNYIIYITCQITNPSKNLDDCYTLAHELGEAQRIIIDTITKAMRGIGKPLNFLPKIQNNQKNNLKITLDFRLKPDIIKRLQGDV